MNRLLLAAGLALTSTTVLAVGTSLETDAEKYSWLNNVQGVGVGSIGPNGPTYEIYALS